MADRSEYNKEYYKKNPQKHRDRAKVWYNKNKDEIDKDKKREYMKKYYQLNKDKWSLRTQEQKAAYNKTRRDKYANDPEYREKIKKQSKPTPSVKRNRRLRENYGITHEYYEELLRCQNGVCAICGNGHVGRNNASHFAVDHDHSSGKIRGLLCSKCNMGIGYFGDDIAKLQNAIEYLRQWEEKENEHNKDIEQ